ncbi:MAG: fructosamine kinase family protein [Burkholderiales bacterium]
MTPPDLLKKIELRLGGAVKNLRPLSGGCVGEVYGLEANGTPYAVKVDKTASGGLAVEGRMLDYLRRHDALPAPVALDYDDSFLLMSWVPGSASPGPAEEAHAAELLAKLHGYTAADYGFDFDTVIGGLRQPNPRTPRWLEFFAEQRLMEMARLAFDEARLPRESVKRIERLAGRLDQWLDEPEKPGLVHGDVWGGNVMGQDGRITGFIDPALYFADPEIELAFITLFSTFGETFFRHYAERRALSQNFHDTKRPLYNLYPLLVHVRLFGGGYVERVAATLRHFTG